MSLTLATDGAVRLDRAAFSILPGLCKIADAQPAGQAGIRLHDAPALSNLLKRSGLLGDLATARLGSSSRAVRAILFDKTEGTTGIKTERSSYASGSRHTVLDRGPSSQG